MPDFEQGLSKLKTVDSAESIQDRGGAESDRKAHQDNTKEKSKECSWYSRFKWKVSDDHSPGEIYNWTLYLSVLVFGILGSARGYDEGNISGSIAQVAFQKIFGLSDPTKSEDEIANVKSNITAMVQLGSIGGCLIAMYTVDKFGRVRTLQGVSILWIVAGIIQITSKNVGQLYAGRLIEGLAIGQTTTIGPTYMSEVAPKAIRGLCNCIFAGAVYFGIMLGYFANYGTALHISNDSNKQWIIPTSVKIPLAGLILIGSTLFCVESPRWLIKKGNATQAAKNLSKLRRLPAEHPYILGEISDINEQLSMEDEATSKTKFLDMLKSVFLVKSVRYRFFAIAAAAQVIGQWSGANAVTIYATELFALSGITGTDKLKMTAVLGVVKFVGAYFAAFFMIDFLGRRKALYIGVTIQMLSLLYFAIFLTIVPSASEDGVVLSASQLRASKGALAAIYISGVGWVMGFNSIQYLLGSEIFPLNIRSFAQSAIMVLHFANQYGNSKALPKMMLSMHPYGAFYFFSAVSACALFWTWFFVPEVSGRSLESMEDVFNLPWYLIGRKGPDLCPDYSEISKITVNTEHNGNAYNGELNYQLDNAKISTEMVEKIDNDQKVMEDKDRNDLNEKC